MKTRVGPAHFLGALGAVLFAASSASPLDLAPLPSAAQGQAVYEAQCALCHGKGGVPLPLFAEKKAPDFTKAAWQKSKTDAQIRKSIVEGLSGTMMRAFGKELKRGQADSLVAYIRTFAAPKK